MEYPRVRWGTRWAGEARSSLSGTWRWVQSLGRPEDRRCVASFGGAARKWLTEHGFVTKFQIVLEHTLCCHPSCFYRYVRFPGVRRPSRELAHRRVLLCSPTRFATDEHHDSFSTLAYALGREASAAPAGQELKEETSELWESKRLAWRAGCELGGKIGTRTAQIHVSLRPPTTHTLPPRALCRRRCALQARSARPSRRSSTHSARSTAPTPRSPTRATCSGRATARYRTLVRSEPRTRTPHRSQQPRTLCILRLPDHS